MILFNYFNLIYISIIKSTDFYLELKNESGCEYKIVDSALDDIDENILY